MEHKDFASKLDDLKSLLLILQGANVEEFSGFGLELKFKSVPVMGSQRPNVGTVPKDPIDQQLAEKHPNYARAFGASGFPKFTPAQDPPPKVE